MAEIEKFDGKDFGFWKMRIEDYLYEKHLHLALNAKKPESMSDADWELLDRQVLSIIRSTLSKSVANNVVNEKTSVSLMASLSNIYDNPSSVKASCDCDKTVVMIRGGLMLPLVLSLTYFICKFARAIPQSSKSTLHE